MMDENTLHIVDNPKDDFASISCWHRLQATRKPIREIVHNDTMPSNIGPVKPKKQYEKMEIFIKVANTWISDSSSRPWKEKSFDVHPH